MVEVSNWKSAAAWRLPLIAVGAGVWLLYTAWRGSIPDSLVVWGETKSGQRMHIGRRIFYGVGGMLFLGLGIFFSLFLFEGK